MNTGDRADRLLTTIEVCEVMQISENTLNRLVLHGLLKRFYVGSMVRFKKSDVMECITALTTRNNSY